MATGSSLDQLARAVRGSTTNNPAWLPRAPQVSVHMGTLTRVDTYNGIVDFQFPDPSGATLSAVRYLQPYTATNIPKIGDVVWGQHYGTDFLIMGQHVSLSNFVIPG